MADNTADFEDLASQYGLSVSNTPPAPRTPVLDFGALASKHGLTISDAPPKGAAPKAVDFDSLAEKHGLSISDGPPKIHGMEKLGGTPPGPVPAPLPAGIKGEPTAVNPRAFVNRSGSFTPKGAMVPIGSEGPLGAVLDAPVLGAEHIASGVQRMAEPELKEKASGLHEAVGGAFQALTPVVAGAALAAPIPTFLAVAAASGAAKGVEAGAEKLGVPPEYAGLAGDVAAILVGGKGARELVNRAYKAAGSPEVKIGGKFEEAKPFRDMTDEELVAHANKIEADPPNNYQWQKEQIVQEAARRQAARGMGTGPAGATEVVPTATPAGPPPATPTAVPATPAEIVKGATFPTAEGDIVVRTVGKSGVSFVRDGKIQRLPIADFRSMVGLPAQGGSTEPPSPAVVPSPPAPETTLPPAGPEVTPSTPTAAPQTGPALPKVGDVIEVSPPSLNELYGRPAPWYRGTVTELRRDPVTGDIVPIISGPAGKEMAGTAGYWRPAPPQAAPAAPPTPQPPNAIPPAAEPAQPAAAPAPVPSQTSENLPVSRGTQPNAQPLPASPVPPEPIAGTPPSAPGVAPAPSEAPALPTPAAAAESGTAVQPAVKHDYSSTQANMPAPIADAVRALGQRIKDEDLQDDGRETEPHVTVKYGLHGEDPAEVRKLLENEPPITATIGKASVFPPSKPDGPAVLKLDVDSPDLHRLNGKISTLEHTNTHPTYKPHITVAYLNPESVDRYLLNGKPQAIEGLTGQQITLNTITFSGKDGKAVDIPLTGKTAEPAPVSGVTSSPESASTVPEAPAGAVSPPAPAQPAQPVTTQNPPSIEEAKGVVALPQVSPEPAQTGTQAAGPEITASASGVASVTPPAISSKSAQNIPQNISSPVSDLQPQIDAHNAKAADLLARAKKLNGRDRKPVLVEAQRELDEAKRLQGEIEARAAGATPKTSAVAPAPAPTAIQPKGDRHMAAVLRKAADGLTGQIEAKRNPAIANQNPTARRAHIAGSMAKEAERLETIQKSLRALADLHESGEVPQVLERIRSRTAMEELQPYVDESGRVHPRSFPRGFMRPGEISTLLEKSKGMPGIKEGRATLERRQYATDATYFDRDQIDAVEKVMDSAVKRGYSDKFSRADLTRPKRLYAAGIDETNWAAAQQAVTSLGAKPSAPTAEQKIREAERELIGTKIEGYFPTPKPLAVRLVEEAEIKPGMSVLEPSAGNGAIADAVREAVPGASLMTVEPVERLRSILGLKGHQIADDRDFLQHKGQYDRIVMNPPFERGQDMDHVRRAYGLLKPGGRVVAVMSEGSFYRSDKKATEFRDWLESVDGTSEKLPEGSFAGKDAQRQTGVATRIVVIDKPTSATAQPAIASRPSTEPQGKVAEVFTTKGRKVGTAYDIREMDDLINSFQDGYPQEYQPRDTERKGSRQRVDQRKGDMNAPLMAESRLASDGAPIALKNGTVITRNHGTQALKELYAEKSPKAAEYRDWVREHSSEFGIDPGKVAGMKQPVLVRIITDEMPTADVVEFAREANMSSAARMSDAEMADMLSRRMTGPLMDIFDPSEDGRVNPEFVRALIQDLPVEEQAVFLDREGKLSQTGSRIVRNAIFAKAYPDPRALERMAESESPSLKNITSGMLAAAPGVARFQEAAARGDRFQLGLGREIADAAAVIDELVRTGTPVAIWFDQGEMFGRDPVVESLVRVFSDNHRSSKRIGEFLKEYTETADAAGSPKQETMFGPPATPEKADVLEAAYIRVKERWSPQQELLTESTPEAKLARSGLAPDKTSGEGPATLQARRVSHRQAPDLFSENTPESPAPAKLTLPIPTHKLNGYNQADLLDERAIEQARTHQQTYENRLLGSRLTAQFASGMAAKPTRLKAAETGDLFAEEGPEQASLFGSASPEARPVPGFYSQLQRTISAKMPNRASADQALAIIRNPQNGLKPDEIQWTGVDDWLKAHHGPVTKQELLDFVKENEVQVQEVEKGVPAPPITYKETRGSFGLPVWVAEGSGGSDYIEKLPSGRFSLRSDSGLSDLYDTLDAAKAGMDQLRKNRRADTVPTKYDQYTLPGGKNYRELLLTLPAKPEERYVDANGMTRTRRTEDTFRSPHWEEPNVLAHVRFNERTGPGGEKILHVEEIQSDWHQEGKRKGYRTPPSTSLPEGWRVEEVPPATPDKPPSFRGLTPEDASIGLFSTREQATASLLHAANRMRASGIIPAPFAKSWAELAFRRMLRYAAENGYDKLTWTTGEQQAERYDLSKQVEDVDYKIHPDGKIDVMVHPKDGDTITRNAQTPAEVEAFLGKEITEKIVEAEGAQVRPDQGRGGEWKLGTIENTDLKIGGEGMKGFYDKILPEYAAKYGKKWGAKVSDVEFTKSPLRGLGEITKSEFGVEWDDATQEQKRQAGEIQSRNRWVGPDSLKVHSIDITPAMRESVMQGQPLFAREPGAEGTLDVSKLPRLTDASIPESAIPSLAEVKSYWGAAQGKATTLEDIPTLLVNNAGMDVMIHAKSQIGSAGEHSGATAGLALRPWEWRNALAEAKAAAADPRPGGYDEALVRIAKELKGAMPADYSGPVLILQTGERFPESTLRSVAEEELSHAKQMQIPGGLSGLPVGKLLDSPLGAKAQAALARLGYQKPSPKSPFYENDRAVMAAEVGVRLMRPGRYKELGLTQTEAAQLAEDYVMGLVNEHGEQADAIVKEVYRAYEQVKTNVEGRSGALPAQSQAIGEGGPTGRPNGPPSGAEVALPRGADAGASPASAAADRRTAPLVGIEQRARELGLTIGDQPGPGPVQGSVAEHAVVADAEAYRPGEIEVPHFDQVTRSASFPRNRSFSYHANNLQVQPIKLSERYAKIASGHVVNLSGVELICRAAGLPADTGAVKNVALHLSSSDAGKVARNLGALISGTDIGKEPPVQFVKLKNVLAAASRERKSAIFVADHVQWDPYGEVPLAEELDHALQSSLAGTNREHFGDTLERYVSDPLYRKAAAGLSGSYPDVTSGSWKEAIEVSVRLMRPEGYKELGLSQEEARRLGARYVRTLRGKYGSERATDIGKEVTSALRRTSLPGREESGGLPERLRSERRRGTSGSTGPDLSGYPAVGPARTRDSGIANSGKEHPDNGLDRASVEPYRPSWQALASDVRSLSDEDLQRTWRRRFLRPLRAIEGQNGIPEGIADVAEGMAKDGDWDALREHLGDSLKDAAAAGAPMPPPSSRASVPPTPPPPPGGTSAAPPTPPPEGRPNSFARFLKERRDAFRHRFGFDLPGANYSGLGVVKDVFVREASQLEGKSPAAYQELRKLAGSRAQASVLLNTVAPRVKDALKDSGISWEQFRAALMESRLQGIRDRWYEMADGVETIANTEDVVDAYNAGLRDLLEAMEGKRGLDDFMKQDADAMLANEDIGALREFLAESFNRAGDHVASMDPVLQDAGGFTSISNNPKFQDALKVYKDLVEKPIAENHASNEGIFSDALGPLDTYIPLIPISESDRAAFIAGRKTPYRKPANAANAFATGLGEYTLEMDALAQRISSAVRANNKAAFVQTLSDHGLVMPLERGQNPPTVTDVHGREITVINIDGRDFPASVMNVTQDRTLIQDGKAVHLPGKRILVPDWLRKELLPSLEATDFEKVPNLAQKIVNAINSFALQGPLDFVFHSTNVLGVLLFKTPYAGTGLLSKTIGNTPATKLFTAIINTVLKYRDFTPENFPNTAQKLYHMAKLGLLPGRYGKETYNRQTAEETGAELRRLTMGPVLFGPRGLDIKTRLLLYDIAHDINPNVTDAELTKFIRTLGDYNRELEGRIERAVKEMGIGPFATAGTTMLRNAVWSWLGGGGMPKASPWNRKMAPVEGIFPRSMAMRLSALLSGGAIGLLALWVLGDKLMTGTFPWEKRNSRFLMTPVPDEFRNSKTGKAIWGDNNKTGYINWAFFSPLPARGSRALGISGGYNTAIAGGTFGQILEGAERDILNSGLHPVTSGPMFRAGFVAATGMDPYITGLRDRQTGERTIKFMPATGKYPAGLPTIAARLGEGILSVNSFYQSGAAALGLGEKAVRQQDQGDRWLRSITDVVAPRLLGQTFDVEATRRALQQERAATARQKGAGGGSSSFGRSALPAGGFSKF